MNFEDILNKWEKNKSRKPAENIMEKWLQKNEVFNKDLETDEQSAPVKNRRLLLQSRPDDILDIHGLTSEQVWLSLDNFFSNAKLNKYKKIRIIHGKGNHSQGEAVLSSIVRKFIEKCPFAGESGYEKSVNGGTGATWVLLK